VKTLLVLRHAKSSWENTRLADHDRPLSPRGKRDAPRMGRLIRELDLVPDLIITSTANRAFSTAELVALESGFEEEIRSTRHLYHAWTEEFLEVLGRVPEECNRVMIVGHNPGLEELIEQLTGQQERMPTAALAQIQLPIDRWRDVNEETESTLVGLWRPREIT